MAIRIGPNGDERDKDVANGMRYAVRNGAKIIHMRFGKSYSPFKSKAVDLEVAEAEAAGVLLVYAAGNHNNDTTPNFPNRHNKSAGKEFTNWLSASFLKKDYHFRPITQTSVREVDFFAPGADVLSTTPDNK